MPAALARAQVPARRERWNSGLANPNHYDGELGDLPVFVVVPEGNARRNRAQLSVRNAGVRC